MTETTESLEAPTLEAGADAPRSGRGRARKGEGLSGMVLTDLKAMASQLGIRGTSGMRKGDLVAAITAKQGEGSPAKAPAGDAPATNGHHREPELPLGQVGTAPAEAPAPQRSAPADPAPAGDGANQGARDGAHDGAHNGNNDAARDEGQDAAGDGDQESGSAGGDDGARTRRNRRGRRDGRDRGEGRDRGDVVEAAANGSVNGSVATDRPQQGRDQGREANGGRDAQGGREQNRDQGRDQNRSGGQPARSDNRSDSRSDNRSDSRSDNRRDDRGPDNRRDDDDEGDGRGRRGRRYRDRNRRGTRTDRFADGPSEPELREDDVLVPVAGILDVLDSYAFIRTSGYLTGPNDVYVSLSQVRKNGLRRGDAVTGAVRAQRDGEQQRQKFNALVRLDSVNGLDPEQARNRPEFTKLTPLYPNERLRLETEAHLLTTRVIDLVMPVGKGQRALIVSPPKAGKTMVMQAIANAITTNNPECHLMVVLVDERPEEVTDMQRSVKGEVIASTFDRPPADHTMVAELSIERAKRLVEMGRDVVVLLDSITRLGRAYNLAAPASGRILSGGVDSTALFPPKRFLGAARNIENGGSLTIFASALVETGSAGDTVIFEEFKGTGNAELKLDRRLADKRIFPAIDVDQSSTRKEDLLMSPDELAVIVKLRRVLSALDTQQAIELVLDRLRKTRSNVEFLMQVAKTTPGGNND